MSSIPKNYFHDRIVLLLLSINTFITLLGSVLILLRLNSSHPESYIVQYRSNLGLDAFTRGNSVPILSFMVFSVAILVFHTILSKRVYHLRRHFSLAILGLASLLLVISVIVSNALLVYR